MDVFSKYSLLHPAQSGNPQEVWGVLRAGWLGAFGPPKCIQTDEGGERQNEIWTDSCAARRVKLKFQGVGARPWLLGRRNGWVQGVYNRLIGDNRFSNTTILAEAQRRLDTMLSASGFSANQMVFGSNPVDFFGSEDGDADLLFAQDASLEGQFVQQWKLRKRAQEATRKEVANSKLRRSLARNKTFVEAQ